MTTPRRLPAALLLASALLAPAARAADGPALVVDAGRPGAPIAPTMWGAFFEDINFGADGGLVAERIKNGAFEFPDGMMGWTLEPDGGTGRVEVRADAPAVAASPHVARLTIDAAGGPAALVNEGFRGIGVKAGTRHRVSLRARAEGAGPVHLRAELVAPGGRVLAGAELGPVPSAWAERSAELVPDATEPKAAFRLVATGRGAVDLDLVSLRPAAADPRPGMGALRADLVGLLDDLRPGFLRFPGGCIVEGRTLANRYDWKRTIGPPESRPVMINRWNDEIKHRPTPDYFQTFALGFFEYFALCEALGAEPLPILNCGMACQFNTGELVPLDQLNPFVQDALDLVEFATGPADSPWGSRRAAMGHPAPFKLNYLGIGNEQWGPQYVERYAPIARAVKAKYPHVQIIASAGPAPADERFRYLWEQFRTLAPDIVDEHCYAAPSWFLDNTRRYDDYDRSGPKVFMGEYAAQSDRTVSPNNRNTWACALAEAAYMTGLERNADVVVMAAYAPLFAHADAWQWTPDLIWFDNLRAYGTPSYHVQRLFARHRGDRVLPATLSGTPTAPNGQPRVYAAAARDDAAGEIILKLVNATARPQTLHVRVDGVKAGPRVATLTTLSAAPDAVNSFDQPQAVAPRVRQATLDAAASSLDLPPHALTIARIPAR
jgi:alpha-N-arabinofuranosidase